MQIMDTFDSSCGLFPVSGAFLQYFAGGAQLVVRNEGQFKFPFGHITIPAPFDGVWVVIRHGLLFFSRVEPEDAFGVPLKG